MSSPISSKQQRETNPPTATSSGYLRRLHDKLDAYFCLTERNTNVWTEFRAGTASFLTLSYLLLVNPQIMTQAGISRDNAVFATALSSSISSLVAGVGGNLPFGLAPGLGLSAYLAYGLVSAGSTDARGAMTCCFASGVLLLLCALTGVTDVIMRIVPRSIKHAIVVGMGILIAMIGMVSVNSIVANPKTLVELGDLSNDSRLQLCLLGVILVGTLVYHDVKGGILIGITVLTLIFWQIDGSYPEKIVQAPTLHESPGDFLDWSVLLDGEQAGVIYPAIGAFLFICIFDISGVMFGLSTLAGIMREDETVPNALWAFIGSVTGTLIAAIFGSTPIIVTVECAAGIKEGGRTGLTSVFISFYFLLSLFLAPLFGAVPAESTAPVLILIGAMMMGESGKINWEKMNDAVPAFFTVVMMPLTYSITNGMVFGLVGAVMFYFTTGAAFREAKRALVNSNDSRGEENEEEGEILLSTEPHESLDEDEQFFDGKPMVRTSSFLLSKEDRGRIQVAANQVRNPTKQNGEKTYDSISTA